MHKKVSTFPISAYKKAGNIIFVSGQIGVKEGELVAGGVEAELRQIVDNIKTILAESGATVENVVAVDVFLSDFGADYGPMNEVYKDLFALPYPARTCVGVKELPRNARVEVKVIAYIA